MNNSTPDTLAPRPVFSDVREKPGMVICDLTWGSERGDHQVAFYDLCVTLEGVLCTKPGCGGQHIRGAVPGHQAFCGCCRCFDRNPKVMPATEGAETYTSIAARLIRQQKPEELDSEIVERRTNGERVRAIARALDIPYQRVRRRLKRRLPGLVRLNPNPPESIMEQEDLPDGAQADDRRGVSEAPQRQRTDAGTACRTGGGCGRNRREPRKGPLFPARDDAEQAPLGAMPDKLTPRELLEQARAAIRAEFPDSHIRKAALDHLDHSECWIADLERLKGQTSPRG